MMKYASNHWWIFRNWKDASLIGFTQMFIVVLVELVNLAVLITQVNILDIIMNFMAIVVISEFDNFFYSTVANSVFARAISSGEIQLNEIAHRNGEAGPGALQLDVLFEIEMTSSTFANMRLNEHRHPEFRHQENLIADATQANHDAHLLIPAQAADNRDPFENAPEYRYIAFKNRPSCCNKFVRIFYLICHAFFVSVFHYWMPFLTIYISYALPYSKGGDTGDSVKKDSTWLTESFFLAGRLANYVA